MPRIVPSQVVATIAKAFPGSENTGNELTLGAEHTPIVAAVYAQIRAVAEAHYALLSASEHALLVSAIAAVKATLRTWETPAHSGLQVKLTDLGKLARGHPFAIIRAALEKCPDSVPGDRAGTLSFVEDPQLALALETDVAAAESALSNHEYKAAAVLAGSVAEALLLWAIQRRSPTEREAAMKAWCEKISRKTPPGSNPDEWTLGVYIPIAAELGIIKEDTVAALTLLREYRNLIHAGRAQRLGVANTRGTATMGVAAMLRLIEELTAKI